MTHRKHLSSRTLLAGLLFAALTTALGYAQVKADSKTDAGVLVIAVQPGSPAEKAGVARGDIILEANGTAVNDGAALRQAVAGRAAGDTLSVKLRHGDAEKTLAMTIGTQDGHPWIGILSLPGRGAGMIGGGDFGMRGPGDFGHGMRGEDGYRALFAAEGAPLENVTTAGPAEKAGLKKGDLILSVDGTTVDARNQLGDLISAKKPGDTVTLSVISAGQAAARDVKATLGKNPDKDAPFLGVQYVPAPPRLTGGMQRLGMRPGALVVDVAAGSPASRAGIQPRDVVVKIDGAAVTAPPQVVDEVSTHKPGDTIVITVLRGADGTATDCTVTLGQNPRDSAKAWLGLSMSGGFGPPAMRSPPGTPPSAAGVNTPTL
ncbi:MAG: PDZ domain-containing protein [Spirochaetia bacterium]